MFTGSVTVPIKPKLMFVFLDRWKLWRARSPHCTGISGNGIQQFRSSAYRVQTCRGDMAIELTDAEPLSRSSSPQPSENMLLTRS